jgi:hypothetical protein
MTIFVAVELFMVVSWSVRMGFNARGDKWQVVGGAETGDLGQCPCKY